MNAADGCLYTLLHAPREAHEQLLAEFVTPLLETLRDDPALDSAFFVRFQEPDWQLRFRILGEPQWVAGVVRPLIEPRVEALTAAGLVERSEFASYGREIERYGGLEGMRLAEQLFFRDSLACLDLFAAERAGAARRSRREFSILIVDRLLDLAGFDHSRKLAFYRAGYEWLLERRVWEPEAVRLLEERYAALRPGLTALFFGDLRGQPALVWGGERPAAIAERFLDAATPIIGRILAAHGEGRVLQEVQFLFWSYTHLFTNRLGIEPSGEAILRYFMFRLFEDAAAGVA